MNKTGLIILLSVLVLVWTFPIASFFRSIEFRSMKRDFYVMKQRLPIIGHCAKEGEHVADYVIPGAKQQPVQFCCLGLVPRTSELFNGECAFIGEGGRCTSGLTKCGDGICGEKEHWCNCEKDCSKPEHVVERERKRRADYKERKREKSERFEESWRRGTENGREGEIKREKGERRAEKIMSEW